MDNTLNTFNNQTLNYNLEKYNWPAWVLSVIREIEPEIESLETLHQSLSILQIANVQRHVQSAFSRASFMKLFDNFVAEYAPALVGDTKYLIQRYGTLRVVTPNQQADGRRLGFHQGLFVGNGRGCRTIWTPLTNTAESNTMWIMDTEPSRKLTKKFINNKLSIDTFEEECIKASKPVLLSPGQSHLFCQEHIHGNINNVSNYTRVAFDMRLLIEGSEYDRKLPGGFFRLPGDHHEAEICDYTSKLFITYAGWESDFTRGIPLPMQRATINKYCDKYNIQYNEYQFENQYATWQPSLEYYIKQKPDGIVLLSIFALTDDVNRRDELLRLALDSGVELHFANELISLQSEEDYAKIHTYLNFGVAKAKPLSWE